jgi:hypothetical protein
VKFAEATALFRVTFFSLSLGICLSFCPALRPCSTFRCSSPPARPLPAWQLTKRALVGGDTEKVALEWANEQVWAGCTGQIAGQERSRFPQYWPFPASPRRRAVNQKRREFVQGFAQSGPQGKGGLIGASAPVQCADLVRLLPLVAQSKGGGVHHVAG